MIKQANNNYLKTTTGIILALAVSAIISVNLIAPAFLSLIYIYVNKKRIKLKNFNLLNFILLFLLVFTTSFFLLRSGLPVYYLPFSIAPMLVVLLFNNLEISLLVSLSSGILVATLTTTPFQTTLFFLIGGTASSIICLGARKRITVIRAGILTGLIQVAILILIDRLWIGASHRYLILFLNGVASSIIVLGILPLFEYLFRTVTNVSLLELADFHHPLLQRLTLEAPGTYHHSLIVGNLSETACNAVGANALLARIGAYYHDIGKLEKSEYFSENQTETGSKHDNLSPEMSKLIIMNHVKEGAELARKYNLSPAILDFINQHHGNSLVYYFYRRALETLEEDHEVREEGFRYPGPKPNSRETAIVLLADSVEAASRALRDPSRAKVEEIVHKVINNKFIDGQLDECELTLKDLENISNVFIRILSGIYHTRTPYPEGERIENNHKKPAKENRNPSAKDKTLNP